MTWHLRETSAHQRAGELASRFNRLSLDEVAERYVRLGAHVIPLFRPVMVHGQLQCSCRLGPQCKQCGKHPRIKWKELVETKTPAEVVSLWPLAVAFNLAMITGAPGKGGGGFMLLDFDKKTGGLETLEKLEHEMPGLGDPPRLHTGGGGQQLCFQWNPAITTGTWPAEKAGQLGKSNDLSWLPGMDTRSGRETGGRGYSCLPPSLHESGQPYFWDESAFEPDGGELVLRRPQPIPEGLLQRVVEAQKLRNPPPPPRSTRSFDPIPPCELQAQLADALNHISADDYEAWWRVGAALHQELGESTGYLLWVRWSATSSKFSEAVCECKWRTFARGCAQPLTRGFVFQQAKLNGWQPPRRQRGKPLTW